LNVRPALAREIEAAARETGLSPAKYTSQIVEAYAAELRIARIEDPTDRRRAEADAGKQRGAVILAKDHPEPVRRADGAPR
jgi:hypothetical protein